MIVVLDARHGIKVNDREMLRFLADAHVKFQVVLNKTDEVVPNDLCRRWSLVMEELDKLRGAHPIVHMVSTATGAGIAPLAAELCQLAKAAPAALNRARRVVMRNFLRVRWARIAAARGPLRREAAARPAAMPPWPSGL